MKSRTLPRILIPLVILSAFFVGCETAQSALQSVKLLFAPRVSAEDCCLCGNGMDQRDFFCWGQNNVALVSLNTFEIQPIEINRYHPSGQLIEEYAGTITLGGGGTKDGFSVRWMAEPDRGYANGSVWPCEDETLDRYKASSFLCTACRKQVLPRDPGQCLGLAVIHLETRELHILEKKLRGFVLGDFFVYCRPGEDSTPDNSWMDLLIFSCPVRYEPTP